MSVIEAISDISDTIYATAVKQGRYKGNPEPAQLLMHIVSETSEAAEAILTDRKAHEPLLDLLLKEFHKDTFEQTIKDTAGDELADIVILAISIAKHNNIPIAKHIALKMEYNKHRTKHSVISESYNKDNENNEDNENKDN